MRSTLVIAVLVVLAGSATVTAAPLHAQARIQADVDTTLVTVGDHITMTVSVQHAPSGKVEWPDSIDIGPFEVLDAGLLPPETAGTATRSTAVFTLAAFELGELEIPSFDVAVVDASGGREVLSTDRFAVQVASVGADESGDIRGIRGPLGIPIGAVRVVLWGLLLLLVAALLYMLTRWLRPRKEETPRPALGPPPRPADEVALEALAALEGSPLLDRGKVKEYHIIVSDILRTYVEQRFRVDALEMTTIEVMVGLERAGVGEDFRDGLRRFLDPCDMVKFAKGRPRADESREVLEQGRQLVLDSARRDPAAAEAPTTQGAS